MQGRLWLGVALLAAFGTTQGKVIVRQEGEQIEVEFQHSDARAGSVVVAGSFNQWSLSASPMTRDADGTWTYALKGAKPGDVLQYKFVTGTTQPTWVLDPEAPDTADDGRGGKNGQVVVRRFLRNGGSASTEEIPGDLSREGTPLATRATVAATAAKPAADGSKNLFTDPGFEGGSLDGWTIRGEPAAVWVAREAGNAHAGEHALKYTLDKPFAFLALRRFTGLSDGPYTLRVWAAGGGGEAALRLFARDCGSGNAQPSTAVVNTGWRKWAQYTVKGIQVKGGECTVGLYVNAPGGTWGNLDDVEFFPDATWSRLITEPAAAR